MLCFRGAVPRPQPQPAPQLCRPQAAGPPSAGARPRGGPSCGPVGLGDLPGGVPSSELPRALPHTELIELPYRSQLEPRPFATCYIDKFIPPDNLEASEDTPQVERVRDVRNLQRSTAGAFPLKHQTTTMEQSDPPVDIHAPFTRSERMQQLADIDRVSNKLPGRPSTAPSHVSSSTFPNMCHRTSPHSWT